MTPTKLSDSEFSITEKSIDHMVDAICACGIVGIAVTTGDVAGVTAGSLVSIALGKRVIDK